MEGDFNVEFMARRDDWSFGVSLYARYLNERKEQFIAQPLVFNHIEPGTIQTTPAMNFSIEEAQSLMDELYRLGLRPTRGEDNAGALKSTIYHLEDMRKLVFKGDYNESS